MVRLTIDTNNSEAEEKSLAAARSLWASRREWQQEVTDYAIGQLLQLKNESWLREDETQLTAEEFAKNMVLEAISTRPGGSFEFWHNDGDLFWGHSIMVSGNLADGPKHAGIEG